MRFAVALLALIAACAERQAELDPEERHAAIEAEQHSCMHGELQPLHFPPSFSQRDTGDLFWTCVLSLQLRRMREPALWPAREGERYRLLVYGHWDAPVAARIEVGSSLAEGVIMEGGGDYGSDKERRRVSRTLSAAERDRVLAAVEAADLWRSPPLIRPEGRVRDATSWVIEGVRDGQYRVFELRAPLGITDNPRYADLLRVLESAAGVRVRWSIERAAGSRSH